MTGNLLVRHLQFASVKSFFLRELLDCPRRRKSFGLLRIGSSSTLVPAYDNGIKSALTPYGEEVTIQATIPYQSWTETSEMSASTITTRLLSKA